MNRKRKRSLFAVTGCIIAAGAAAFLSLWRQPRLLLQSARVFCVVPAWRQGLGPTFKNYYWITADEALILPEQSAQNPGGIYRAGVGARGVLSGRLPFALAHAEGSVSISRDGNFMAYFDPRTEDRSELTIVRLDGKPVADCSWRAGVDTLTRIAWAPDGNGVVVLEDKPELCLKRFDIGSRRVEKTLLPRDLGIAYGDQSSLLGFTGPSTVLIARRGPAFQDVFPKGASGAQQPRINYPTMSLIEVSLPAPPRIIRTFAPAVPAAAAYGFVTLSPLGDKLLWGAFCVDHVTPLQTHLHNYLSLIPGEDTVFERAWISRLDGSSMRDLGTYEIPPDSPIRTASSPGPPWIIDPKWTPDGKRIGFIYKDRLFTISAE